MTYQNNRREHYNYDLNEMTDYLTMDLGFTL